MRPTVRVAGPDDVAEIARIQSTTWRTAYADTLGGAAELDPEALTGRWSAAVAHPETDVHVALEGSQHVGFCVSGPAPASEAAGADDALPDDAAAIGLVGTVLVEPRWGRRGHGGRLLAAVGAALVARGASRGITWVLDADSATLSFFRRAGWEPDATVRTLDTGERMVREVRLTGDLELRLTT